jgi:Tol biopolymer transport system component
MAELGSKRVALILCVMVLIAIAACTRTPNASVESAGTTVPSANNEGPHTPSSEPEPSPTVAPAIEPRAHLGTGAFFVNVRTGKAVRLPGSITSIEGAGNYDVSPDGTMLLFDNASLAAASDEPVERGLHQLYVANIDGTGLRQLTDDPIGASQGSWSSDGTEVVYLGRWARLCCWLSPADLMVLDVATGATTQLRTGPARAFQSPFFSADGSEILFTRPGSVPTPGDGAPQADLWKIPVGGGDPQVLLGDRGGSSYSPDGATITFPRTVWFQQGNMGATYVESWISDADGTDARRLTRSGGPGNWSPNGRWIYFRPWGPPNFKGGRLQILDVTTGRTTILSAGHGQDWLDDETLIVVRRGEE